MIIINAFFSLSEFAIVSARPARLAALTKKGSKSARIIESLKDNMSSFLASVQIGITGVGIVAGVFSGANFAEELSVVFVRIFVPSHVSMHLSYGIIVAGVTFLSIFIGELIPKQLALHNPEKIALVCAKPMVLWVKLCHPLVRFLNFLSQMFFSLVSLEELKAPNITEEEIKMIVEQGTQAGVFALDEETIIKRSITLGDRKVIDLMTPRVDIISLDMKKGTAENLKIIVSSPHSYYPFYDMRHKKILGLLSTKKILQKMMEGGRVGQINLKSCLEEPLIFPESMMALNALQMFKKVGQHYALVIDEHGDFSGIFTLFDLFEGIVGALPSSSEKSQVYIKKRADGGFLVDGATPIFEFFEFFKIAKSEHDHPNNYSTVGGLVMEILGAIPAEGQYLFWQNLKIEIIDMDGNRVDKIIATPQL